MPAERFAIGGCFVCFERPSSAGGGARNRCGAVGDAGERGWAAAAVICARAVVGRSLVRGRAGSRYEAGLLALREGALLEDAVRGLPRRPDLLLVNATGRDHPRRAGLALHLGAVLDLPTIGVTHRPLLARGSLPAAERGARAPLRIGDELVAHWLRVVPAVRPLVVDTGWRTESESACTIVLASTAHARTPEPLREARRLARSARARES